MINVETIEAIAKIISINKEDIIRLLNVENNVIDIYEDYNKFIIDQQLETTLISRIIRFTYASRRINFNDFNIKNNWLIVCKLGYIQYIKEFYKYFIEYYLERFDLSFFTRFRLSITKAKRKIKFEKYSINICEYSLCPIIHNKKIKRLFDTKSIKRLYIIKQVDDNN